MRLWWLWHRLTTGHNKLWVRDAYGFNQSYMCAICKKEWK